MSTAQQPQQAAQTTREETSSVLDQAVAATEARKSIIRDASAKLGVAPDKLFEVLAHMWSTSKGQSPLTKAEMFTGLSMIARYDLDPVCREIYVTRDNKGRLMTIIGLDGWIKILDRTPGYDGFDQEFGWSEDGNDMVSVRTTIYSKARSHPTPYVAYAKEYAKLGGNMAEKIPWHMLRIFSLKHAARLFTPVGGSVYTEEEARWMREESRQALISSPPDSIRHSIDEMVERHKQAAPGDDTSDEPPVADDASGPRDQPPDDPSRDAISTDAPATDAQEGSEGAAASSDQLSEKQREAFGELSRRMMAVRMRSGLDKAWDAVKATFERGGITTDHRAELSELFERRADEMAAHDQKVGGQKTAF